MLQKHALMLQKPKKRDKFPRRALVQITYPPTFHLVHPPSERRGKGPVKWGFGLVFHSRWVLSVWLPGIWKNGALVSVSFGMRAFGLVVNGAGKLGFRVVFDSVSMLWFR